MTVAQIASIVVTAILIVLVYFTCDTTSPEIRSAAAGRTPAALEATDLTGLLMDAKDSLTNNQASELVLLERRLQAVEEDTTERITALKKLSGKWYEIGNYAIAGTYAMQVAELENTPRAHAIAGTTLTICVQRAPDEKVKTYCNKYAEQSFLAAASLAPEELTHRINLALLYADNPPADNPMKGILQLLELNKQAPDNVSILVNLARLGTQTGQYDKAAGRLERAVALEPDNLRANCLLAEVYTQLQRSDEAAAYGQRCRSLAR